MKKPAKPDAAIEVTKKAPEKAPLGATSGAKDANKAPTSSSEEFRGRLARSIKAAGRWMEDNAKGISGSVEGRRSLDIHLSWECSGNEIAPTINIDSDFICREAIAEMHRKEIEKMKKNPGRKERRRLARLNRRAQGRERAKQNEKRQRGGRDE